MNLPDSSRADDWPDGLAANHDDDSKAEQDLWDATAPPDPGGAAWGTVGERIADAVLQNPADRLRVARFRRAVAASAAVVLVGLTGWLTDRGPTTVTLPARPASAAVNHVADDPLAGLAVLPIAAPDEVEVLAVRGGQPMRFVVGESPLPDRLLFADPGEVRVTTVRPPAAAVFDDAPGERPMIVGPRPR